MMLFRPEAQAKVQGLGFRVWGLGFGVYGWGLGVGGWGLGVGVWGLGCVVWRLGLGGEGAHRIVGLTPKLNTLTEQTG